MQSVVTTFDTRRHHIYIEFYVTDPRGVRRALVGVIDTGAPRTEMSDQFLDYIGFINLPNLADVTVKSGLETQKYGRFVLPSVEICDHALENFEVYISRFSDSWGIDALIGLDFFRLFRVTIDYKTGCIVTEPLAA